MANLNKKIAVYYRFTDKKDALKQRAAVQAWCDEHGIDRASLVVYRERLDDDTAFKIMMKYCRKGQYSKVLVYNLSLISSRIYDSIRRLQEFDTLKTDLIPLTQPCFTLKRGSATHKRVHDILHELAETQRAAVAQRTRTGIANYRKKNRGQWGRTRIEITAAQGKKIMRMREQNVSYKEIAKEIGLSVPKIYYYCNPQNVQAS